MEFQLDRFIGIFIYQSLVICTYFYFGSKLLRNKKNLTSILLGSFFFLSSAPFIITYFLFFLKVNPLSYVLYLLVVALIVFGITLLVPFGLYLTLRYFHEHPKRITIVILVYLVATTFLVLLNLDNISYNETTEWRPLYQVSFLITLYLYFFLALIIPLIWIFIRITKMYSKNLQVRLSLFFLGISISIILVYMGILYNSYVNELFRLIYGIISPILFICSGYLTYRGVYQKLKD